MGQIMYTYPAMMGTAAEMGANGGILRALGEGIAADQSVLAASWTGDTGQTYQAWQQQWNMALEQLVTSYAQMQQAHESNTLTMQARDAAEGAKWA